MLLLMFVTILLLVTTRIVIDDIIVAIIVTVTVSSLPMEMQCNIHRMQTINAKTQMNNISTCKGIYNIMIHINK